MERQRATTPILTDREKAVLVAAADGLTAREIGRRLGVSERTVTTHLNHIYRKLNVSSRVAALSAAWRLGLITTPFVGGVARGDDQVSSSSTSRYQGSCSCPDRVMNSDGGVPASRPCSPHAERASA